jgi:hypothetical protein
MVLLLLLFYNAGSDEIFTQKQIKGWQGFGGSWCMVALRLWTFALFSLWWYLIFQFFLFLYSALLSLSWFGASSGWNFAYFSQWCYSLCGHLPVSNLFCSCVNILCIQQFELNKLLHKQNPACFGSITLEVFLSSCKTKFMLDKVNFTLYAESCMYCLSLFWLSHFPFLNGQVSSRNLDRVRKLKSAMTRLTARVQKVGV